MLQHTTKIPMYCINLQRATERKQLMEKYWVEGLGLDIVFWDAYDRRDVERGVYPYPYNSELSLQTLGRELSTGEIACSTSFANLYKHIIANDIPEAIIMEDDIVPTISDGSIIYDAIQRGKEEFPQAEMMMLYKAPPQYKQLSLSRIFHIRKENFSQCMQSPKGNYLFYITKKGVEILLDNILPIVKPADHPADALAMQNKLIIINNPLCTHDFSPQHSTYIGNNNRNSLRLFIP